MKNYTFLFLASFVWMSHKDAVAQPELSQEPKASMMNDVLRTAETQISWLAIQNLAAARYLSLRKEGKDHYEAITALQMIPSERSDSSYLNKDDREIARLINAIAEAKNKDTSENKYLPVYEAAWIYHRLIGTIKVPERPDRIYVHVVKENSGGKEQFRQLKRDDYAEVRIDIPIGNKPEEVCRVSTFPAISHNFTITCNIKSNQSQISKVEVWGSCLQNDYANRLVTNISPTEFSPIVLNVWCSNAPIP